MKASLPNLTSVITPGAAIVSAVQVLAMVVCVASYENAPESALGSFLHEPNGITIAIVTIVAFSAVAGGILGALGHPMTPPRNKSGG